MKIYPTLSRVFDQPLQPNLGKTDHLWLTLLRPPHYPELSWAILELQLVCPKEPAHSSTTRLCESLDYDAEGIRFCKHKSRKHKAQGDTRPSERAPGAHQSQARPSRDWVEPVGLPAWDSGGLESASVNRSKLIGFRTEADMVSQLWNSSLCDM